jgi:hypothetical protein
MFTRSLPTNTAVGGKGGASRGGAGRSGGSIALWSAVALQQHMVQHSGLHGILPNAAPRRPLPPAPAGSSSTLPSSTRLSLAQKMGLVEAPPPPPTEPQWESCVQKAATRNDVRQPCAICCEPFLATVEHAQVILDCSHVFHQTCIQQLEKFARRTGNQPTCPICRRQGYHKRLHCEGKVQAQHHAATRIQSLIRGVLARKRALRLRLQRDPKFRSDYAYEQLRGISDSYMAYAVSREKEVDSFLEGIDLARQIAAADMMSAKDWESIRNQVLSRHESLECPICMGVVGGGGGGGAHQPGVMLSCAHCFHSPCFAAYESVALAKPGAVARCPVCRSGYRKRPLVD